MVEEDTLEMIIDAARYTEADIRTDYSGDFMFGKTCFGIVGDMQDYGTFLVNVAEEDAEVAQDLANSVRTDSMAMSTIFYWEHLEVPDEDAE